MQGIYYNRSDFTAYRLRSQNDGLSHGLKIARQLSIFTPACGLAPPFQVLASAKKDHTFRCGLFWQGHKDLNPEPTVLETRLINQPLGGFLLKLIFQLSKRESPPYSQKPIQKSNKLGISSTNLRSSGSTVFYAETVGSESIS